MAKAVVMPKAGISVESCIIGKWRKKSGDAVGTGEVLFDYETDKATFECESTADGTLLEIFFEDGEEVPCLTAVCAVGQPGEDVSGLRPNASQEAPLPEQGGTASPAPQGLDAAEKPPLRNTGDTGGAGVSPRARDLAEKLRINPEGAVPTGPRGRVIARDIQTLAESLKTGTGIGGREFGTLAAAPKPASAPGTDGERSYTDEKFTKIRSSISTAMHRSLSESAQLTHHHSCNATAILAYRKGCKTAESLGVGAISLNDMVMYAVARTLKEHSALNAHMINGDTLRRFHGVHLGMAVDTPRGLIVPTIFDADQKSLKELADTARELAGMAKSGSISPDLLQGGSFTVSNLGSLGVEIFTPIINPPQVAILGVCGITTRVREGVNGVEAYPALGLSLTYDHRAVDGAPASRFVQALGRNLEQFPLLLAL